MQAERKYSNFDPLPDADNAAVGSHSFDFLQETSAGCLLFFYAFLREEDPAAHRHAPG